MKKVILLSFIILSTFTFTKAQRGKDGAKVVNATESVNAYSSLIFGAGAGNTILNVTSTALNNNFAGNLTAGDLLMVYQPQGAFLGNGSPITSSTWGAITNYVNCGNYEFVQVSSVLSGTQILLECPLVNNYSTSGGANSLVIRVPRYSSLTINAGGTLTVSPWNGSSGGILAIEVDGITTINAGGSIDVSNLGFRGGQIESSSTFGGTRYADNDPFEGAEKGEGIGGDQVQYSSVLAGRYTRGAPGNGGGGGNAHNAGGAGGANAGNPANWTDGAGVPSPLFNASWALETPSLVGITNSGGGRGGYSHCGGNANELTQGPGNPVWGGDNRRQVGGLGGRPLDYSTGKIFIGGAGGAGDGETTTPGAGGNGAGIIFMCTYGDVTGFGNIRANGQDGFNCEVPGPPGIFDVTGKDAAGGAGAGGTILIKTTGLVSSITIDANGGSGGNQVLKAGGAASIGEAEGPGGGGGGGYIAITTGAPIRNTNGGIYGTTNSPFVSNFNANGSTSGGIGLPNESIDAFDIIVDNDTICPNTTSTLTATIMGTAPIGAVIEWYDSPNGGTLLFTGNPYTTPSLAVTTTYYVTICPAPFRIPVTVYVNPCSTIIANFSSTDSTLCVGDCINFSDLSTGAVATGWTWSFPGAATTSSSAQNPTNICYNSIGSFDVELIVTDGTNIDTLLMTNFITVNALPTVTAGPDTSICLGDNANIYATGATSYSWNNGLGAGQGFSVSPILNTTYIVTGTDANGCVNTDQTIVTINALPTVTASNDTIICSGDQVNLSATGATSYFWNNGLGAGQTQTPSPGSNIVYTVTGTDNNGCINTDLVNVTVNSCGAPPVTSFSATDSSICIGDCIDFNDLSVGAPTGWTWYFFGAATSGSNNQNPTNICYNSVGSFDVALVDTNSNGQDSLFISGFITVNALPTVTANSTNTTICAGDQITLTGSGAVSYSWNNGAVDGVPFVPAGTTTYTVIGTDANGCTGIDSIVITVNSCAIPPVANFSASGTSVCIDDCIDFTDLSSGGSPTTWSWYFFGANPSTSNDQHPSNICYDSTGTFNVALMVTNAFGQDSIFIANYITVDSCNSTPSSVIIPNVFSPNGDGHNDLFSISGTGIISIKAQIYNRWGGLLFSSEQLINTGWNGRTTSGTKCSEGTYFYILNVETINENKIYKGTLTLIR
ncbi:MAG: gliding motility-associated C-terminal domain-containing protein [Flavobacteriales bacterium]|nr:gliding motility-associated C-terminal domain-containing protein [Flavobacteriales bacterium]